MGVETLVAAVLVAVGIAGIVLPVLPGLVLVLAGIAVWAVPRNDAVGWSVLGIAVAVVVAGTVARYLLPGRRLRDSGGPGAQAAARHDPALAEAFREVTGLPAAPRSLLPPDRVARVPWAARRRARPVTPVATPG